MNKLEKTLKEWLDQKLINKKQMDQILLYESNKAGSSWVLFGLLVLGIIVISIGVISLIAANWQQIPDSVKLIADFVILIFLGLLTIHAWELKQDIRFEVLLLFFILLCLASIGLISQIYNTGGELYQALMLWSLITLPVVTTARYVVVPFIWMGGFLIGLAFTAVNSPLFFPIFNGNITSIIMTLPLFCVFLGMISRYGHLEEGALRAIRAWFYMTGVFAILMTELSSDLLAITPNIIESYIPVYFFAALTLIAIVTHKDYNNTQKLLLLLTLGAYLILVHLPLTMTSSAFIYAFMTILLLGLIAIFAASQKQRRLFQWILFFIGLRFLILYFQALGGLAQTGLGLIISGTLIVIMAILWGKYKLAIALWVERWVQ